MQIISLMRWNWTRKENGQNDWFLKNLRLPYKRIISSTPQSGSFSTATGSYEFGPLEQIDKKSSSKPKYKIRKVKFEGIFHGLLNLNFDILF